MVMSGRSNNLTTLFLGRLSGHTHMCPSSVSGREKKTVEKKNSLSTSTMYVAGPGIEPATYGSSVFDKWRRLQSMGEINGEKLTGV